MEDRRWEKLAALTGVAFVVTVLVSSFLVPQQIKIDDSINKIGSHFVDHRTGLLWANWIGGLAGLFVLWFIGTVASYLRRHGAGRLATIALAGGIAATGIGFLGTWISGALTWMAGHYGIGTGAVRTLWTLSAMTNTVIWFPVAVFVAATAMAVMRTGSLPAWVWQSGAVVALLELVASTTWASHGFWAPMGGFAYVGFIVFALWVLGLSIALWQRVGMPDDAKAMEAERPMAMTS